MSKLNDFIEEIPNSEKSKTTYRTYLNTFSKAINVNLNEWIGERKTADEYTADIIRAINELKNKAPKTVRAIKSTVNSFLEFNNIWLDKRQMKRINRKIRGRRAITLDRIPKGHEIRAMLEYTTDPKMRAIILIGCSSGMRIDEILNMKTNQIELDRKPPTIYVSFENAKDNESRTVFISNEAKKSLQAWLKIKDSYKESKSKKAFVKDKQKRKYDKTIIFPLTYQAVRKALIRLLKKAGLEDKDISGRYKIHLHSFKKFFKKHMKDKMLDRNLDYLASHDSELGKAYTPIEEDELRKDYLENMHNITIYETQIDYAETEERIIKLEKENKELKEQLNDIAFGFTKYGAEEVKKKMTPEEIGKMVLTAINISNEDLMKRIKKMGGLKGE